MAVSLDQRASLLDRLVDEAPVPGDHERVLRHISNVAAREAGFGSAITSIIRQGSAADRGSRQRTGTISR